MIVYPLTVIHIISLYNARLFNSSPAVVVLRDRSMSGVISIMPSSLRYEIYIHIWKILWSDCSSQPVDWPKLSCLLLLPWCTAIGVYHTSSTVLIVLASHKQWLAIDKQTNYYWAVSLEEWKQPQIEYKYDNSRILILFLLLYAPAMV